MCPTNGSPNRIAARERARKALELRKAGAQYVDIATALGYADHSGARRAVERALARLTAEPAAELRQIEVLRLDRMLQALWEQAVKGNQGAIDRVLKIAERRAKLLGLDAPEKLQDVPSSDPLGLYQLSNAEAKAAIEFLESVKQEVAKDPARWPDR